MARRPPPELSGIDMLSKGASSAGVRADSANGTANMVVPPRKTEAPARGSLACSVRTPYNVNYSRRDGLKDSSPASGAGLCRDLTTLSCGQLEQNERKGF
jgi:hypothetical protein